MQLGRFDELGSGVINVNKYLPFYVKGAVPTFEEEANTFHTIIPLEPLIANGELNGELNEPIIALIKKIAEQPGIQAKELAKQLNRPFSTVDKQIRTLTARQLVIHRGSRKTGGYYRIE
jgi:predicted HTH transcriptional regulator